MNTTQQLVSQLVLAAQWDHEDGATRPAVAAANMLGLAPVDPRVIAADRAVEDAVEQSPSLTWAEQVGVAAHLLLTPVESLQLAA